MNLAGVYFFEDDKGANLAPVTAWNAPWDILCGTRSIMEYAKKRFPDAQIEGVRSGVKISLQPGEYLFLNARLISLQDIPDNPTEATAYLSNDDLAFVYTHISEPFEGELWPWLKSQLPDFASEETSLPLATNFWDYTHANGSRITSDSQWYAMGTHEGLLHERAVLIAPEQIYIGRETTIAPGVVLDASKGPIIIEENASVGANAVLSGPLFIDKETVVNPLTIIRPDVSLGFHCKVGGEVASTIMMSFSNKGHYGYLGRSMVGAWCNLGAGSATSTIKNTYGDIAFGTSDGALSTGIHSLGSLIGDHVKIGTNTVLSPGASIGAYSNLFGSGPIPRFIPAFSWVDSVKGSEKYALPKVLEVTTRVLSRRQMELSEVQKLRIEALFNTLQ